MTIKRIKRSVAVEGNQVTIDNPQFITLVKKPANQRSFSILRAQEEEGNVSKPTGKTRRVARTTRRTEGNQDLVSLTLPGDLDEAGAKEALAVYGLSAFTVARSEDDTTWVASNPSAINCTDTTSVRLGEGIVASVRRTEANAPTEGKGQLTAASLEFSAEQFPDATAVSEWCQRNSVDFDEKALNNPSGNLVLQRAEVAEGEETRLMELEEGVTVTVIRSCDCNIPDGFVAVINEYAYSGWGWGQLDFNAALADDQVGDALYDGLYILEDLLRNILFWSPLPVDVRKELTTRACTQFASYANGLLDTLPRQLLISVSTTTQRSAKENDMSNTTKAPATTQAPIKREEAAPAPAAVEAPVMVAVGSPEFNSAVADSVTAVLAQREEKRIADEAAEVQRKAQEETDKVTSEQSETARRAELTQIVAEATKPLLEEITALKSTTVLRSTEGDLKATQAKRGTGDLFKGCLGIARSAPADRAEDDASATE
jgi:hypothetical protein